MKFIHIADVHLGAEPEAGHLKREDRARELWDTFEEAVGLCDRESVDLLLIAGDLFHRQPLVRELKEVNYLFSRLSHTRVVLIAGNHDYIRMDSNYRTFQWADNVYPLFGKEMEYVEFPDIQTSVCGLSYHAREIRKPLYDGVRAPGVQPCEILLAHGGDDRHIPIDRDQLAQSGFDYIALGHIHKPQALIRNRAVYAGALEPVDRNDTGAHGYVYGEIKNGEAHIRWIPFAGREYVHLEIPVEKTDTGGSIGKKIEKSINESGNENIYKILLKGRRDADIEFDTGRLAGLGNIMEVLDETAPDLDLERICEENRGTLIRNYIERFAGCEEGSEEYQALCEGVEALLASRR
ncbi:DNA repair exonuclease [Ruminococcus sp. CLA-AA-H200]|uniref:DNA repair exonuclease n=1 Tax=Ruminococcus turbiniformis TaxID=2881258 RepID=A0ABS8FVX9_9FIRM|nr:DNA repair exonuclease [Ruminococcus turbiniformis]MCC2254202.1 DNA repair exonuclease [Ruminococcus turbiniformis]